MRERRVNFLYQRWRFWVHTIVSSNSNKEIVYDSEVSEKSEFFGFIYQSSSNGFFVFLERFRSILPYTSNHSNSFIFSFIVSAWTTFIIEERILKKGQETRKLERFEKSRRLLIFRRKGLQSHSLNHSSSTSSFSSSSPATRVFIEEKFWKRSREGRVRDLKKTTTRTRELFDRILLFILRQTLKIF